MRPRRLSPIAIAILVAAASLVWTAAASAEEVYKQGDPGLPFTIGRITPSGGVQVTGGADQSLALARVALATFDAGAPVWAGLTPDPRMAVPLKPADAVGGASGHILVADRNNKFVAELDRSGAPVWMYKDGVDGASLPRPFSAMPMTYEGRQCVLIADRWLYRVFAVEKETGVVVWQYGTTGERGLGVDQLEDPFTAVWVPADLAHDAAGSSTVLIADNNDGNRVLEVRVDDYQADEPGHGFTASSVVWQYGTGGISGDGVNELMHPRSPQRLADGNTLIADALAHRVVVVRTTDYDPGKADYGFTPPSVVWEYRNAELLEDPNMATRLGDGTTLIADCGDRSPKVLWIGLAGTVKGSLDMRTFEPPPSGADSEPRSALLDPVDGSLVTSDSTYTRVLRIGNRGSAVVESPPLDCGRRSMIKRFDRFSWTGQVAPGQGIAMWYRIDGHAWRKCTRQKFDFPSGSAGKKISYRVALTSADRWTTPVLDGFAVMYDRATQGRTGGGGGGADAKNDEGANSGTSHGVYMYPGLSGTGTSGGGTAAGSSGYGSGSGTTGAGTGGATSAAPASSAGVGLVAPATTASSDPEQSVTGVEVQGVEGVSGIPLTAAAGAHVKQQQAADAGEPVSIAVVVALSIGALAGLLLPWPAVAANLREIGGTDHTRARRIPPFKPLGR